MGRRSNHTCFIVSEISSPSDTNPLRTAKKTKCSDEHYTTSSGSTNPEHVSCPTCSERLAIDTLSTFDNSIVLGERIVDDTYSDYRSEYPILDNDVVIGHIRLPYGWGKKWEVARPVVNDQTRFVTLVKNPDAAYPDQLVFHSKSSALVWAIENRDRLNSIAEAQQKHDENVSWQIQWKEDLARKQQETRDKLDETISSLRSLKANHSNALTERESIALDDAIGLFLDKRDDI